jgi:vacuolar-type H+-ATPase subunit H
VGGNNTYTILIKYMGVNMNAFDRVNQAEYDAAEITDAAKSEAERIISNAVKYAKQLIEATAQKAQADAKARIDTARAEGKVMLEQSLADLNDEKEALIKRAQSKQDSVISILMDALVS